MNQVIEITLDEQGRLLIPASEREHVPLVPGMKLIVENGEEGELRLSPQTEEPSLVRVDGVLVARGELLEDVTNFIERQRERRIAELINPTGL